MDHKLFLVFTSCYLFLEGIIARNQHIQGRCSGDVCFLNKRKRLCHQTASAVKRRDFSYVSEGHNTVNALELATAAHSHGGIAAISSIIIASLQQRLPEAKPVIPTGSAGKSENLKSFHHIHMPFMPYRFGRKVNKTQCNKPLPPQITVELAIFVDYAMYDNFLEKQASKMPATAVEMAKAAETNLKNFVFTLLHNAQLLLDAHPLNPQVKLMLSKFSFWKNSNHGSRRKGKKRGLNMASYMRHFCEYQKRLKNNAASSWDHAMLLSGFDLLYGAKDTFSGYGTTDSICLPGSCSVVEAKNFKSAYTIVHELGHALGLRHDGQENNCSSRCCIMGPIVKSWNHRWSDCSKREIQTFLKKLQCSRLTHWCLDRPSDNGLMEFSSRRILPGQKFPLDEQCRMHMGPCYKPFFKRGIASLGKVCQEIWCTDGSSYANASHAALEGTYCGFHRWCRGGRCVQASRGQLPKVRGGWSKWHDLKHGTCAGSITCTKCIIHGQLSVKRQIRTCTNPTPNNGGLNCQGSAYKAVLCSRHFSSSHACSGHSTKVYASKVCRLTKNKIHTHSIVRNFTGVGIQRLRSNHPCVVWCKLKHSRDIYTFFDQFPDGTPCGSDKYCVAGKCMNLSCNGKEISETERSEHHSCFSFTGKFQTATTTRQSATTEKVKPTNLNQKIQFTMLSSTQRTVAVSTETIETPTKNAVIYGNSSTRYQWTSWAPWSTCSRTCGRGFRKRVRYCKNVENNRVVAHGADLCPGKWKKYQICAWKDCM